MSIAVFVDFMKHVVPLLATEVDTKLTHEILKLDSTTKIKFKFKYFKLKKISSVKSFDNWKTKYYQSDY